MAASWLKSSVDEQGRRSLRFVPMFVTLEDRAVPAVFYVDPSLAASNDGDAVTFNNGKAGAVSGLVYSSSFSYWNANQATANTFGDFATALKVAEASAGADTINLAIGLIPLNNTGSLTVPDGDINAIPVTQSLTIRGSGLGASVVFPVQDTQIDFNDGKGFVDDSFTPLFRVAGANAKLTAEDFRVEGSGRLVGAGFLIRDGAAATFDGVGISGIIFDAVGASTGASIIAIDSKVDVLNTEISNYGRNGILFFGTTGSILNSQITGRGAGIFANNGIELSDGSVAMISGNLISANNGTVNVGDQSSGVIVAQGDSGGGPASGKQSIGWVIGNTITGNTVGLNVGAVVPDTSKLAASYNNIVGNQIGAFGGNAINPISAKNNWWGDVSGPFNATSNPTGLGNSAGPGTTVVFAPAGSGSASIVLSAKQHPNPEIATLDVTGFAAGVTSYLAQITTFNANIDPVGPAVLASNSGTFQFNITFAAPVQGLTIDNIVVTTTMAGTAISTVSGSGANYVLTVNGLSGSGTVTANVLARAADDAVEGFLTAASNSSTITVAIPNQPATISTIPTQTTTNGAAVGPLAITVGDDAGPNGVVLTGAGSNPALVAAGSLTFAGAGANRTLNFTTTAGVFGTSIITVTATDTAGAVTTSSFLVNVPNMAPTVSTVADQAPAAGATVGPLSITVGDDGGANGVTLTGTSSNPALVSNGSIVFSGTGAARGITFVAAPNTFGTATITVTATDALGALSTTSFAVNVPQPANGVPTIGSIPANTITLPMTSSAALPFQVSDPEGSALTLTATSSNPGLVPVSGISFGGSGGNRTVTVTPTAGGTGNSVITITVTDAVGGSSSTSFLFTVDPAIILPTRTSLFAVGSDAGGLPEVAVYGLNGKARNTFLAYESAFTGGVTVVTADVNGDLTDDIITGAGVGGGSRIRVFNGIDGSEIANFFAYDTAFRGGATVGAADLDGDGRAEVITGAGFGGGPHVKAYRIVNGQPVQILNFMAFDVNFRGGVTVAAGLVGGNTEIVVGAGPGGGPQVRRYTVGNVGDNFTATDAGSFLAGAASFTGGVFVTIGSFGGTVGNSIATSLGAGSSPVVTFRSNGTSLNAYEPAVTSGVRIGSADVNADGVDELLVAPGKGGGARIQALSSTGASVLNFFAFVNSERDGYFVG